MQEDIEVDVSASAYVCRLSRTQRCRSTWVVRAQELTFRGGLRRINRHCTGIPRLSCQRIEHDLLHSGKIFSVCSNPC